MSVKVNKLRETGVAGTANSDFVNTGNLPIQVHYGQIVLTTANSSIFQRRAVASVIDENNNVFFDVAGATTQGSNISSFHHEFYQGVYRETVIAGTTIQIAIPIEFLIPPGWTFRVNVANGIATDTYSTAFMFSEFRR